MSVNIRPRSLTLRPMGALFLGMFPETITDFHLAKFGLVAEEVAAVNPNVVVRDRNGEIYTVRYDALNAMLLNEFLKEHRKVTTLESTVAEQQKQIQALTVGLQEVKAQVETSRVPPASGREQSLARTAVAVHSFRSASLNAMVRSTSPVESRTRISPERKQARFCA